MSAAVVIPNASILPFVWAIGADLPVGEFTPEADLRTRRPFSELDVSVYRRYTEAMLQRYVRLSMEAGKVPSLLGQEMFRGKVTSYRVGNFDDVVIFLHDVDRCLARLDSEQQQLIARMSLQQYTVGETARLLGLSPRTVIRRYALSLDRLTRVFLNARMLEPLKFCQGGLA